MKHGGIENEPTNVGIVGTGFVARGVNALLSKRQDIKISKVLTRRPVDRVDGFPKEVLTNSPNEVVDKSDIVIECSGDPLYATDVIHSLLLAAISVITFDCETQIVSGSFLRKFGYLTEAEGDQPGCLAALKEETEIMGFEPLVYGNIKGFLNHNPTLEDMKVWSQKNGTSLTQTIAFTDGTKVQIEQALVANGLNATIIKRGLMGIQDDELKSGAERLALMAEEERTSISDYILSRKLPAGVFIVGKHKPELKNDLRYLKMGEGPYYTLLRPYHLVYFEVEKTLERVLKGDSVLLNNGPAPIASVAGVAKRPLLRGEKIDKATGSFLARGEAVKITDTPDHVPIGLLQDVRIVRSVEPGDIITFADIEIKESLALKAWLETIGTLRTNGRSIA